MASLKNTTKRTQTFNLEHTAVCKTSCVCKKKEILIVALNPRTGEKGRRAIEKKICPSIILLGGQSVTVDSAVKNCAEVSAAIAAGTVKFVP